MEQRLLDKIYSLKEALNNDSRVKELLAKEKAMEENEEVMVLSYHYSLAQNDYSDALKHYPEGSEELAKVQRQLYQAKMALDSHPLVKDYLKAYQEVRLMYKQIEDLLIGPFTNKNRCK